MWRSLHTLGQVLGPCYLPFTLLCLMKTVRRLTLCRGILIWYGSLSIVSSLLVFIYAGAAKDGWKGIWLLLDTYAFSSRGPLAPSPVFGQDSEYIHTVS